MGSDVVIRAEGLGKRYIIGHDLKSERYTTLRDVMARRVQAVLRRTADMARGRPLVLGETTEEVWALKDVSFEVRRGEVLGVVGRNGAGKSTLLKILSRITEPSEGRLRVRGRVASLLEVGTGFHPELTGRENIYLNAAILGMTRAEVRRKFDEIVAFADVARFLDTPVKRYSSGMYVRLAFAVAAHLEPDILVVDEVLAVGDEQFQKKCLGRMKEVSASGRTVLLVSHNLGSLLATCEKGILLDGGEIVARGSMKEVAKKYRASGSENSILSTRAFEGPLRSVKFEKLYLNGLEIGSYGAVRPKDELKFAIVGRAEQRISNYQFFFSLFYDGIRVLTVHRGPETLLSGKFAIEVRVPPEVLRPGIYAIALGGRQMPNDMWCWGTDLAEVEVIQEWSDTFQKDDVGLINLSSSSCRFIGNEDFQQTVPEYSSSPHVAATTSDDHT